MRNTLIYILRLVISIIISVNISSLFPDNINGALSNVLLFLLMLFLYKKEIQFPKFKIDKKDIIYIFVGSLVILVIDILLIYILPKPLYGQETRVIIKNLGLIGIVIACIIAPITEEYIFRCLSKNHISTIIVASILFGLLHIQITSDMYSSLYPVIVTFINGLIFLYFYKKSDNLYVSIFIHSIINMIALRL